MKKILLIIILILSFLALPIFASPELNTHSIQFESTSSQYAYTADSADLSITGDLTIEAWIRLHDLGTATYPTIAEKNKDAGDSDWYFMVSDNSHVAGQNELFFYSMDSDNVSYLGGHTTNALLSSGVWYHVAVVVDVSVPDYWIYVDGVSKTLDDHWLTSNDLRDSNANFYVGSQCSGTCRFFDGLIDDLRIWNDIRTEAEIQANDQCQLNGNEQGLMAYYMFNNSPNDNGEVTDPAGANANDLTLVNSPPYTTTLPFASGSCGAVAVEGVIPDTIWW